MEESVTVEIRYKQDLYSQLRQTARSHAQETLMSTAEQETAWRCTWLVLQPCQALRQLARHHLARHCPVLLLDLPRSLPPQPPLHRYQSAALRPLDCQVVGLTTDATSMEQMDVFCRINNLIIQLVTRMRSAYRPAHLPDTQLREQSTVFSVSVAMPSTTEVPLLRTKAIATQHALGTRKKIAE